MKNWESLIADRIERHRDTYKPQRIEDPGKRNRARATMKWRREHTEQYQALQKAWREANPEKIKTYEERRKKDPARIAYKREYNRRYYELKKQEKHK